MSRCLGDLWILCQNLREATAEPLIRETGAFWSARSSSAGGPGQHAFLPCCSGKMLLVRSLGQAGMLLKG